jgi:hypothetical protein
MAEIATWIFFPSFALTLIAGMLAIAVNPAYHNAGWAWVKLATGILVLSGNLQALGPIQVEAKRSAGVLARQLDPESITGSGGEEIGTLWVLLAVQPRMSCLACGGRASRRFADIETKPESGLIQLILR